MKKVKYILIALVALMTIVSCASTAKEVLTEEPAVLYVKETVFAKKELAKSVADLQADGLYQQIAASSVDVDYCGRNLAKLVSDDAVIFGVNGGLYLIGILPEGSPVPEGMVELKIEL